MSYLIRLCSLPVAFFLVYELLMPRRIQLDLLKLVTLGCNRTYISEVKISLKRVFAAFRVQAAVGV